MCQLDVEFPSSVLGTQVGQRSYIETAWQSCRTPYHRLQLSRLCEKHHAHSLCGIHLGSYLHSIFLSEVNQGAVV